MLPAWRLDIFRPSAMITSQSIDKFQVSFRFLMILLVDVVAGLPTSTL